MLELKVLQEQLGKKGKLVTQDTVDELNKLSKDPDYSEEFVDYYVRYFNILEKSNQWTTPKYMNALKFFSLVEANHSLVDAYVKTFPERLEARHARGEKKSHMGGEASRYNSSELVNEIRKVARIPVELTNYHTFQQAVRRSVELMNDPSVSPAVQQKAAETLIRELKPKEDSTVNIKVGMSDEAKSQQAKLVDHIGTIALQQQKMLAAGMNIAEIQKLNIQISSAIDVDVEDAEYDEDN